MIISYPYNSLGGGVCSECGALVLDVNVHTKFHENLEDRIKSIEEHIEKTRKF